MPTRRSIIETAFLCALCVLIGALAQAALTEAHLEADELLRDACSALTTEAMRVIEAKERMIAPPDAVAITVGP